VISAPECHRQTDDLAWYNRVMLKTFSSDVGDGKLMW